MKLLVAFVQESDAERVADALRHAGHRFTRIASTGGFLETPNVTIVMAVHDETLPEVVEVFRANCSVREVEVPLVLSGRLRDWQEQVVNYAGATILIAELSELIRL
jgi:uncharacterized protein YaaQ